jgi:hypothetical protein
MSPIRMGLAAEKTASSPTSRLTAPLMAAGLISTVSAAPTPRAGTLAIRTKDDLGCHSPRVGCAWRR